MVNFTPRSLYHRSEIPRYQLDRILGGPHIRSGRGDVEKNYRHVAEPLLNFNFSDDVLLEYLVEDSYINEQIGVAVKI
jgi:hypothetical protein